MVEYKTGRQSKTSGNDALDATFNSLADPTRRDILKRVAKEQLSVSQLAAQYHLTFAAISKHLKVLEKANLITKTRRGKEQIVSLSPGTLANASNHLETYKKLWENKLDSLDNYLKTISSNKKGKK